ncbi:MAG: M1 family aminopeptidase [Planctomycetota bacterium]
MMKRRVLPGFPGRFWRLFLVPVLLSVDTLHAQAIDVFDRPVQLERSRDFDAQHYCVTLAFDLEAKSFRGENHVTLTPLQNGWNRCRLDAEELIVDAVRDPEGRELVFEQAGGSLEVVFAREFAFGDTVEFTVFYHGSDPQSGLYFDEETPEHPRMVSTDSWPNNARRWIPCYDYPNDKVTQELIVTAPAGNKVLSNGRLMSVSEDPNAGTTTWHWRQDEPHATYLFMLAIGPFTVIEDSCGSLPVEYWVYPKDAADAEWIFAKTPEMIEFYGDLFGYPYPWAKYDQVTTPHVGGGAEATSATVLGQEVIHDRRAEQDFSWERIIAHETAHHWWGDLVTMREWSHAWINESFATYSDYLYTRHERGPDEGAWDLKGKKEQYLHEAKTRYMRPIVFDRYNQPHDNFDSHTYPKGAAVLHMLRFVMGDEPFFATLSHFLHTHAFQSVDTHDFMTAVKDRSGQNMDWFFEQFLYHPGHPVFEVGTTWDEQGKTLRLRVAQVQDTTKGIPIYRIPVDVGIATASEKRTERLWLDQAEQMFTFDLPERPLLVRFDEGNHLLKEWTFPKDQKELVYQAKHDDVIGRAWAAGELRRFCDDPEVVVCLTECARTDPFWAVRRTAVETLHGVRPGGHDDLFRTLVADPSSKVRVAALHSLAASGRGELLSLFRERFEQDDSYLAQVEALRGIGRVGGREDLPFLKRAAAMPSPRGVVTQAAKQAIAEIVGE